VQRLRGSPWSSRQPRLGLHEAIERFEVAQVVGNGGVEHDAERVDKAGLRAAFSACFRERIKLHAFTVGDRSRDVGIAAALEVGAENRIALISIRLKWDVAVRDVLLVVRRENQVFAAFALVHAGGADVLQRVLPSIVLPLEATIQASHTFTSLPVLIISEPQRILSSRTYARQVVERLVEYLIDVENLRGTGRLYLL